MSLPSSPARSTRGSRASSLAAAGTDGGGGATSPETRSPARSSLRLAAARNQVQQNSPSTGVVTRSRSGSLSSVSPGPTSPTKAAKLATAASAASPPQPLPAPIQLARFTRALSDVDARPSPSLSPSGSDDDDVPEESDASLLARALAARQARAAILAIPFSPAPADSPAGGSPDGQRHVAWDAPSPVGSWGSDNALASGEEGVEAGDTFMDDPMLGVSLSTIRPRRNSEQRRAFVAAQKREEAARYERLFHQHQLQQQGQRLARDTKRRAQKQALRRALMWIAALALIAAVGYRWRSSAL